MLKIWGRANSVNVQKVLWCCAELDLPFQRTDAGLEHGINHTPEFHALNPNELVPVIDDEGFVLWESQAIVRYLARRHGLGTLCPPDAATCADADRWMDWNVSTVWQNTRHIMWNLIRTPAERRNMEVVEESRRKLTANMHILEEHLAGRTYLTRESFNMGDIPLGTSLQRWFNLPMDRPSLPRVQSYYELLQQRPGFRQHVDHPLS